MIGVLLASHGTLAQGMLDSLRLFFSEDTKNIATLCLQEGDDPRDFGQKAYEAIQQLNDGSGVIVFVDLLGGTPNNQISTLLKDPAMAQTIKIISGMNLGMIMEFMGRRNSYNSIQEVDPNELLEAGRNGIQYINRMLGLK